MLPGCQKIDNYLPHPPKTNPLAESQPSPNYSQKMNAMEPYITNCRAKRTAWFSTWAVQVRLIFISLMMRLANYPASGETTAVRKEIKNQYVYIGNRIVQDTAFIREGVTCTEVRDFMVHGTA